MAVLVQLSGVPGCGKSTLARGIARATAFVVVDSDVLKSALIENGVPLADAGRATYAAALGLSRDLMAQGRSVVIDSPCRYQELLDAGLALADDAGVGYCFIELWAQDVSMLLARLDGRTPTVSQLASATGPAPGTEWEFGSPEATLLAWQDQLVHPDHDWLRLDAAQPKQATLEHALRYISERQPP